MKKYLYLAIFLCSTSLYSQTCVVKGFITNSKNNSPLEFVTIQILDTQLGTTSDEKGYFEIRDLKPGVYSIKASTLGFDAQVASEILITNAKPNEINFALSESAQNLKEVEVVSAPFTKTEESPVSLRTIGATEIQRNPGSNRDISKVVQVLPGVTSSASFRNDLIIRGGAPNENRFYLDDVEVPNINHFATQGSSGGPVGLINVTFIREVDFYSGAFPANRGNTLSSVFNFKQRDGRNDRIGATITAGSSDAGITLEGPIGSKTTFLASARRSYLQFLFKALELPFLPTYNDFQLKVKHKIDQKNEIYFVGLGAIDQFKLNFDANKTESQQYLLNNLPVNTQWNYTNGLVYKNYQKNGYWTFVLSRNMLNNQAIKYENNLENEPNKLILDYKSQEIENKFRAEHTLRFNENKLVYGISYESAKYKNSTYNKIFVNGTASVIDFSNGLALKKYGGFVQYSRKFLNERLSLSGGFRLDANDYSPEMSNPLDQLSPRFSLSYSLTPKLSFNANTGIFFQLPPYTILGYTENNNLINKQNKIKYINNNQLVAGFEYNTSLNSRISIEAYYKTYQNYPLLLRDSITLANIGGDFGVVGNEPAIPFAEGRSYGVEFLFQQKLFKGFYGIIAYTLGRSEFQDKNKIFIPSSWDSRHIVNLSLGKKLKRNWEVGVNWRFQSGLPTTPFDSRSALVTSWELNGRALPDYNLLNTNRQDAFNQIDFRVDKRWYFKNWNLNIYLDIENINAGKITSQQLILDRPLDENNQPIGGPVIENPNDPVELQRYKLKTIDDVSGTVLPSIGLLLEF